MLNNCPRSVTASKRQSLAGTLARAQSSLQPSKKEVTSLLQRVLSHRINAIKQTYYKGNTYMKQTR